jgi:hypothetical protein
LGERHPNDANLALEMDASGNLAKKLVVVVHRCLVKNSGKIISVFAKFFFKKALWGWGTASKRLADALRVEWYPKKSRKLEEKKDGKKKRARTRLGWGHGSGKARARPVLVWVARGQ